MMGLIRSRRPTFVMRAVGSYVFAGGFTLGVKRHFDVDCVLEETAYGVATARHNQPEVPVHVGFENWPLAHLKEVGIVDFVYGNPPCAAWSVAGKSTKHGVDWRDDARVNCTRKHFSLLEELRPRAWAWESVVPAFVKGRELVDELTVRATKLGYHVTYLLHDARHLGVPQRRQRFFFVATDCRFDLDEKFLPERNADDALRGLNDPGVPLDKNLRKYPNLLAKVRDGESLIVAWQRETPRPWPLNERGQVVGRPAFTITRCPTRKPAHVVMHEMIHPTEHRGLSLKELATLCGYPPSYEFVGAKDAGQVGRGVCPPVGEWLARNVAQCLGRDERDVPTVQLIDVRELPGKTTQLPVPELTTTEARPVSASTSLPFVATRPVSQPVLQRSLSPTSSKSLGSGAYLRGLMVHCQWTDEQLLEAVHTHFSTSKATKSDVAWNRARLARELGVETNALRVHEPSSVPVPSPNEGTAPPFQSTTATGSSVDVIASDERQPSRHRQSVDPEREFDKTSLRANSHGQWVHRDYLAHAFRWGFAGRFVTNETELLDVGCGPDVPMVNVLTMPRNQVPRRYVGVDLNHEPQRHPNRQWAELRWDFNFIERWVELGQFDLVTNFEMIEHVHAVDARRLLVGLRGCLKPDGLLLLSTPVFNGKAAANHLHEFEIVELQEYVEAAGLRVERRFGTFINQRDLRKVADPNELAVYDKLRHYYSDEVMATFLAPLYPDHSRNNLWMIRRAD